MTYAAVAVALRRASSRTELLTVSQLIQHVESICDREALARIFKSRAADFKQQ